MLSQVDVQLQETTHIHKNNMNKVPVKLVIVQLLDSEHHDQPWMDDLSTYEGAPYHYPSDNTHCIHHNRHKLHSASLDQFQYQDDKYCMLSQMQEQLGCEDGKGPSLRNVQPVVGYHTDNDSLDKDLKRPVWCQRIHFQESHLCPSYQLVHQLFQPAGLSGFTYEPKENNKNNTSITIETTTEKTMQFKKSFKKVPQINSPRLGLIP